MDDGNPLLRVMMFIGFIVLDAVFYGFGAAIQNVSTSDLEDQLEDGNKKAGSLLRIVNRPTRFVNTIQITSNIIGMVTGAFVLRQLGEGLGYVLSKNRGVPVYYLSVFWWRQF